MNAFLGILKHTADIDPKKADTDKDAAKEEGAKDGQSDASLPETMTAGVPLQQVPAPAPAPASTSTSTSNVAADGGKIERRGRPRKYPPKEPTIPKPIEYNEDGSIKERRGRKKKSLLLIESAMKAGLPPPTEEEIAALYTKKAKTNETTKDGQPAKKRGRHRLTDEERSQRAELQAKKRKSNVPVKEKTFIISVGSNGAPVGGVEGVKSEARGRSKKDVSSTDSAPAVPSSGPGDEVTDVPEGDSVAVSEQGKTGKRGRPRKEVPVTSKGEAVKKVIKEYNV